MNENFIEQLACAFRKVGTIHTVGEEWHSYTGEIPVGGVPYLGHLVTRETYSALFAYAEAKGLVKTETEWQELAAANNGNVPFYSDGDGSTTFRMPKIVGYFRGASTLAETGSYVKEGLPNIEGTIRSRAMTNAGNIIDAALGSNAFSYIENGDGTTWGAGITSTSGTNLPVDHVTFDASKFNSIYGNDAHVTPETSVVLFGVYAFGALCNVDELDAATLSNAVATVEAQLANYLPLSGGTMTGNLDIDVADAVIRRLDSTGRMIVRSSTGFETGASLYLYGNEHEGGGAFRLYAHDGTTSKALMGKPDGTLTWDGNTVLTGVATTSKMGGIKPASAWVKILSGTDKTTYSYTATKNCFVCAYNNGGTNNMDVNASIGGVKIFHDYGHHNDGYNSYPMFFLAKGQTITLTQDSSSLHFSVLYLE